jgi:hypothetical protein
MFLSKLNCLLQINTLDKIRSVLISLGYFIQLNVNDLHEFLHQFNL